MIVLELPWPPSTNTIWRNYRGITTLSKKAKAFYAQAFAVKAQYKGKPVQGRVKIGFEFYPPNNQSYDIDNRFKAPLDLLVKSGVLVDDSLVYAVWGTKQNPVKGGRCVVTIERIEEMAA